MGEEEGASNGTGAEEGASAKNEHRAKGTGSNRNLEE